MDKKRVILITANFYPNNSPRSHRATELTKELCRQGHDVTVLTPSHEEQSAVASEFGFKLIDLGQVCWSDIPIPSMKIFNMAFRAFRRVVMKFLDYPDIELKYRVSRSLHKIEARYDAIISIAAPHSVHWGVSTIIKRGHKTTQIWIADCGDPFMGRENSSFSPAFYFRWLEKGFCKRADWITVPTKGSKDGYYPEFREKLVVIPQGFRFEDYATLSKMKPNGDATLRFAFAGLFIPGRRDPRRFLDYLTSTNHDFEFHIFTKLIALVEPYAKNDSRVILRDFIPRGQLLLELASMDFLLNIENAGKKQTPSKLIDYWLCGRPILNIKSNNFDKRLVDDFMVRKFDNAHKIDDPDQYRIENVVSRFLSLMDSKSA